MSINWFFISSLLLSITSLSLLITLLRFGHERSHRALAFFYISLSVWAICATLASISLNPTLSNLTWRIGCVGVTFTAPFVLHFFYSFTKKFYKKILIFTYTLAVIFSTTLLTSTLILKSPSNYFYKYFLVLSTGNLYWLWFAYWFSVILYAHIHFFIIIKNGIVAKNDITKIILGFLPGFYLGALNFLNPFDYQIFQFGNFGIVINVLLIFYFIFSVQFIGIQVIIKKGLIYSILIGVLTGIYLLLIMIIEWIFRGVFGYKSLILSFFSAFIIAILFNPLRNRLQLLVDRIFLGKTSHEFAKENELLKQQLERSERLKATATLALGLAHEVRNPLTTIKTFAEFLPEKYKDDDFVRKFSRIIPSEVDRINSIIKQLLDFSKPALPTFRDTNIRHLIDEILTLLASEFLRKNITVDQTEENQALVAKMDPSQIKQAVLNIVLNALDAMPRGGVLTIRTNSSNENYLNIIISDTGCGISKEDLGQIFDPFFTNKDTGSGLGLAITYQIIKNHNGTIEVESTVGKGTTFTIKLPLERSGE